jgi:hypothetical protein
VERESVVVLRLSALANMKKLLSILGLALVLRASGQPITIPGSQFPVVTGLSNSWRFLLVCPDGDAPGAIDALHSSNATIAWPDLLTFMAVSLSTNQILITNLVSSSNSTFVTNITAVTISVTTNFTFVNSIVTNIVPLTLYTNVPMTVATQNVASNQYWLDFGVTNEWGQKYVYQDLLATNNPVFCGITNNYRSSPLSFRVIASGGDRTIFWNTNWLPSYFYTNVGIIPSNTYYAYVLSNKNELRVTMETFSTNQTGQVTSTNSLLWTTFGQ